MKPLIEIKNLYFEFNSKQAILKDINLKFFRNSFTVITGRNGSGKTILIKHFNGLLKPTEGSVFIDGIPIKKDSYNARKKVGLVFQNSNTQIIGQTVMDDIAFGPENMGLPKNEIEARIKKVSKSLGLETLLEKSPHRLSGGEMKKTALAGILAMQPEIIIFDEPFTGLDYEGVRMILRIMIDLKKNDTSIIVVTHDLEKVLAHADRLVVMADGKIVGDAFPENMLQIAQLAGVRIPQNADIKKMSWLAE